MIFGDLSCRGIFKLIYVNWDFCGSLCSKPISVQVMALNRQHDITWINYGLFQTYVRYSALMSSKEYDKIHVVI